MLRAVFKRFSAYAQRKRAAILASRVNLPADARVIDLGGNDGGQVARCFPHWRNVTVCDLSEIALTKARARGFKTIHADAAKGIPVPDKYFDFCFCSSVIEHVTGPKAQMCAMGNGRVFRQTALAHQQALAAELRRISKSYYVQTPHPLFPIESHCWLPAAILLLPRAWLLALVRFMNVFWPKKATPDWNLLSRADLARMFPEAEIVTERFLGFSKSLIAIRRPSSAPPHQADRPARWSGSALALAVGLNAGAIWLASPGLASGERPLEIYSI
jgi:2-polyprenyl-3-methyl-5-hydroxy-6-metoxy-1,4-benzoquinol methylase